MLKLNSGSVKQILPWRLLVERERGGLLLRLMPRYRYGMETCYLSLKVSGLQAEVEFPSDWHEERRAWVRVGFGLGVFAFSFPWSKIVPDDGQCSGPTYGFQFYRDLLWIRYGKEHARVGTSKRITINMPWSWKHREHIIESGPEAHTYRYILKNGTVQDRTATIQIETRLWTRWWIPWRQFSRYIDVRFDDEVGERSGSWKGGTIGCSYDLKVGETALDCLRRMERNRKF